MKKRNPWISAAIICTLAVSSSMQSFANGPEPNPNEQEAKRWARLQDNVLEYDEIEDLIKEYNPAVQISEDSYNTNLAKKRQLEKALKEDLKEMDEMLEEMGGAEVPEELAGGYQALKGQASSMRASIKNMQTATNTASMKENRNNLSMTTQNLMISYNQKKLQKEVLQKDLEVVLAAESSAQSKAGLGLATDLDILNAQKTVRSVEAQIRELDSSIDHLRQSLCLMTGWAYNANPDIQGIPSVDLEELLGINLQEDIEKAIGNNYTLRGYRSPGSSGNTMSSREIHTRNVEDGEQKVKINMESLYSDIQAKRIDYETAVTNFQKAESDMQAADRKYQLGIISREDHLTQQAAYTKAKADKEEADMTLFQTWETYRWAVRGMMSLQ